MAGARDCPSALGVALNLFRSLGSKTRLQYRQAGISCSTGFGYKRAMLCALGAFAMACLAMPQLPAFWMTKLLFAVTGTSFATVKVPVYACGSDAVDPRLP